MADTVETGAPGGEAAAAERPAARNLDLLLDVPLDLTVEIGRARVAIRELLQLGQGSVLELAKAAGEPLDVLVNGKPVARGEAVMVNDRFGIRLTDILSPSERLAGLR
jgi:flagellar motor switch protein FliN/FliY